MTTKLTKATLSLNPDSWKIAELRTKGYTYQDIYKKFEGKYTLEDISYMIKQVAECNKLIALDNPDLLRQTLLDEIDAYKRELLVNTEGVTDEKIFNALMKTIEVKAKLLGLNAPERQEIDVVATIRTANETLTDKLNMWRKTRGEVIDVTPVKDK